MMKYCHLLPTAELVTMSFLESDCSRSMSRMLVGDCVRWGWQSTEKLHKISVAQELRKVQLGKQHANQPSWYE